MTVIIDGSQGEGGGQVLRTSLTLSVVTGQELRIDNIRANRSPPGLKHQHLAAVRAAAEICDARVKGDQLGSSEVKFKPGTVQAGEYRFGIPTAGSAPLVLQTILIPLARAGKPSRVTISGGTHVRWSPCFHYLAWHWFSVLREMGYQGELTLNEAGYYPQGGGQITARVEPARDLRGISLVDRGGLEHIRGLSAVSNLPEQIARRQRKRVVARLGAHFPLHDIKVRELPSPGKGTLILLLVEFAESQACFFSLGERGKRAERVADEAVDEVRAYLAGEGAVDAYLGDQLLIPLSLIEEESAFSVGRITSHLMTNAEIIKRFVDVVIRIEGEIGREGRVEVQP